MIRLFTSLILLGMLVSPAEATDIIFNSKSATSLNPVTLYTDSTFSKPSKLHFKSGALFEILGETKMEHEDDAQNQKFKWFKVKSQDGQSGWIFGDALATILPDSEVTATLSSFHKKNYAFNNGFENAVTWIATIEGRDNFHKRDYLNPPYKETYLVITNDRGRSVHINIGGVNARGKFDLKQAKLHDTTGDHIPEFLVQTNSFGVGSEIENRKFEIYSFQAGTLAKVFEERMTLNYTDDVPSPALFKHIEVSDKSIRIAYVDYLTCSNSTIPFKKHTDYDVFERCMEYVTYTYLWDERLSQYKKWYKESRTSVKGAVRFSTPMLTKPSVSAGTRIKFIRPSDQLDVIKQFETFVPKGNTTEGIAFLYVRLKSGEYGYISANKMSFVDLEHNELLIDYYRKPLVNKGEWKSNKSFLTILSKGADSAYNK